ncbi:MAG TPA: hypothetical protein VGZ29_00765 [Terriglobia bacterium]|nr:hypothetical protein [Terriglobia bacterium]
MFVRLLIVTFVVALVVSTFAALLFSRPIGKVLSRLVSEELAATWRRYILFATFVVGISGGARLWEVEKYITPDREGNLLKLTSERWIIEVYKTVIGSLQSIAWMLLVFFLFALIAYVTVRGFEMKRAN